MDAVNPSPGFCLIGDGTSLREQAEERNVDLKKGHIYWETRDGSNNYLLRMERHRRFCELATRLKLKITISYNDEFYKNLRQNYFSFLDRIKNSA